MRYSGMARGVLVVCCAASMLFASRVYSQIAGTGNMQGTVTDSTGAVIPNASVTLTDEETHVVRTTKTNGAGDYVFPGLPVGTYDLSATTSGFRTYVQRSIVLEVGSSIAVNPQLSVGNAEVRVEVQSEALALQTEDASFKQTIDEKAVTEMPLNGRQMTSLITLSGGSNVAPGNDFTGSKYSYATISVSVAGGNGNTTLWRLDGGDNQDYMGNGNLPFPFPDAVSQFSVESTALGAQEGEHSGGYVNVVTRSGTNNFHGSGFEFIRNNYVDATNFFSPSKDTLHQNQFGGTFGGPINRNKLFAFAGYQRTRSLQSQPSTTAHVPTAANLAGDFSVTDGPNCEASGKMVQLVDPITGAKLAGNKYATQPTYDPAALALQKYLPPIDPKIDTEGCGVVNYAIPLDTYDNQFVTRVDWTLNPKHNLYGRYLVDGFQQPAFFQNTNILITTQSGNTERVQSFTLGDAYTFTPRLVNAAHATILRRVNNRGYAANDINAQTLGVDTYQAVKNGLYVSEGAQGKFTIGGGTNSVAHFNDNALAVGDDLTWIRGRHQFAFGGEWVQNQLNINNSYEQNGIFSFNGQYSANGPNGGSAIGDLSLDFLMGTMSAYQQSKAQQNALRGPIPSLYAQDTFHATHRLTLVAGVRWSPNIMPHDYFNRGSVFNMADFLSDTVSSAYPNAPAGILFYGDKGVPRTFTQNSPWQFSPNVGLSFDPSGSGRSVVRAGAELLFDQPNFFTAQRIQQNPPFATAISNAQTSSSGPLIFSAPWSVGTITSDPFPQPQVPSPSQAQFFPQSQYIVMPDQFHAAYTIQWTASMQHDFPHGWQAQLDYIGNTTRHDPLGSPLSPAVFIPGEWGASGTGCSGIVTSGPAKVKPGAAGTNCSTTKNQTSRFALTIANPTQGNQYLGGGGGSVLVGDEGTANYHGLVATMQHRLSPTFNLLANWTWSKCLDIADGQGDLAGTVVENPANPRLDYGPCGFDYRHVENLVIVARSAFHGLNRYTTAMVNNWELAPLMHITSGAPLNVISGQDNSLTDVGNDRPNLLKGISPYQKVTVHSLPNNEANREYLNPAAFAQVTAPCGANVNGCPFLGTYGNVGRNAFRTPKFFQFDSQISRIFPIHESLALDLRLEAFNVLNHPNFAFSSANQNLTSSTFGQITGIPSGSSEPPSSSFSARVFQGSVKIVF